jgi:transcriptional antiterminator NusG
MDDTESQDSPVTTDPGEASEAVEEVAVAEDEALTLAEEAVSVEGDAVAMAEAAVRADAAAEELAEEAIEAESLAEALAVGAAAAETEALTLAEEALETGSDELAELAVERRTDAEALGGAALEAHEKAEEQAVAAVAAEEAAVGLAGAAVEAEAEAEALMEAAVVTEAVAEAEAAQPEAAQPEAAQPEAEAAEGEERPAPSPFDPPGDWYVVHTYAGYENKVKSNLHSRIGSMQMEDKIFDVVIPMEDVMEIKGGKKQVVQRKVFPGYLLVKMIYDNDSWYVVRNTPGVTGFVSSGTGTKPTPLSRREVEKILAVKEETQRKPEYRLEWEEGDVVRIIAGPFADFQGTIDEINVEQSKLKVLVNIFDRETPVELAFDQVAKA